MTYFGRKLGDGCPSIDKEDHPKCFPRTVDNCRKHCAWVPPIDEAVIDFDHGIGFLLCGGWMVRDPAASVIPCLSWLTPTSLIKISNSLGSNTAISGISMNSVLPFTSNVGLWVRMWGR